MSFGLAIALGGLFAASPALEVRFDPVSPRRGDLLIVYVSGEVGSDEGTLSAFGYETALLRAGTGLLRGAIAVPLEAPIGPQEINVHFGDIELIKTVDVAHREFDESVLQVGKKFTSKPDAALRARQKREEAEMQAIWKVEPSPISAWGPIVRPVQGEVTGNFGTARVFNGKTKSTHLGLDLDGAEGDSVRAAASGTVVMSSLRWASGGTLVIDHGGGLFTTYFHLSRRDKKPGEKVAAGELIGAVGKTGRVTGPHLHLAVLVRSTYATGKKKGQARSMYAEPAAFLGMTLLPWNEPHLDPVVPEVAKGEGRKTER